LWAGKKRPKYVPWVEKDFEFCKLYQAKNPLLECEEQPFKPSFSKEVIQEQALETVDLGVSSPFDISVGI